MKTFSLIHSSNKTVSSIYYCAGTVDTDKNKTDADLCSIGQNDTDT